MPPSISMHSPRGVVAPLVIVALVAIVLVGGGLFWWIKNRDTTKTIEPIVATVQKGEFVSQVLDKGEIQSSENVEIRCQVTSRNGSLSVIEVVQEGSRVKPGDFLVRLDSSAFDKELEQQKIQVANAETAVIQAKAAVAGAKATKKEYLQGAFVESEMLIQNEIQDAKSAIDTAKQEIINSEAIVKHSTKLAAKGFITKQSREAEKFELRKAKIALAKADNQLLLAETKMRVLREITKEKELIQLNSDIEAADVSFRNETNSLEVEKDKMTEVMEMIEKCVIEVPEGVEGQVVYAKESSRGGNDWVLEEGTSVRERQVLIRLPNPEKMEVKALVNEQSITQIRPGMPCSIKVDALSNVTLNGIVTKVNQYAESSGWGSSSVRKYAVFVKVLNPPQTLKPGMNASCSIQTRYEEEALLVPLQTVYAVGDQAFCLVKSGESWETREIEVDGDNSEMALVKAGLEAGDELVMNPGAYELLDLPEINMDSKIVLDESQQNEADALKLSDEAKRKSMAENEDGPSDSAAKPGGRPGGQTAGGRGQGGQGGGRPGGGGGGPGGGGGFSMGGMIDGMMSRYDSNADGKIDADEMGSLSERAKPMVERADANSDGSVTKDELKSAMEKMMKERGGGGGGRPGGGR